MCYDQTYSNLIWSSYKDCYYFGILPLNHFDIYTICITYTVQIQHLPIIYNLSLSFCLHVVLQLSEQVGELHALLSEAREKAQGAQDALSRERQERHNDTHKLSEVQTC